MQRQNKKTKKMDKEKQIKNDAVVKASRDNAQSQYDVAVGYATGVLPGGIDFKKSRMWCQQSVEQGYADAFVQMGLYYLFGQGVDVDYRTAYMWFEKGVLAGAQGKSYYFLGYCYENGFGIPKDIDKAKSLYQAAGNIDLAIAGLMRLTRHN